MSKFLLRNLKNEKRRLVKELAKIQKKIDDIENQKVVAEGTVQISIDADLQQGKRDISHTGKVELYVECIKRGRKVECILRPILKTRNTLSFVGVATCATDDVFDIDTGINLAYNRAIQDMYKRAEEMYK